MSKTLEQLAGQSQTQQGSNTIGNASSYQAGQRVVGESLAQDILSIIKPASTTVQEYNTASVKAAQRSAMDKKTETALFIADQDSRITNATTSEELRKIQIDRQQFFTMQSNTRFDNEDAQEAFDGLYIKEMGVSVAQSNAKLESRALEQDDVTNYSDNVAQMTINAQKGLPLGNAEYTQRIESMTAGNYTKPQAEESVSKILIQNLEGQYETLKNLPIYDENGAIKMDIAAEVYNNHFGTQSQMVYDKDKDKDKDDGKGGWSVVGVGGTDVKVVDAEQDAFDALLTKFTKNTSNIKIDTDIIPINSGSAFQYARVNALKTEHQKAVNAHNAGRGTYSQSSQFTANKNIAKQEAQATATKIIEDTIPEVINGTTNFGDVFINKSGSFIYSNPTTGETSEGKFEVTTSNVTSLYQNFVNDHETNIGTSTDQNTIDASVYQVAKLENNTQGRIKSPLVSSVYKDLNDGVITATNLFDMNKQLGIANVYGSTITDNDLQLSWLTQKDGQGKSVMMQEMGVKYNEYKEYMTNPDGSIDTKKEQESMFRYNFLVHTKRAKYEKSVTYGDEANMVRREMQNLRADGDMINWGFGTEKMDIVTMNTVLADAVTKDIDISDVKGYAKGLVDSGTTMEISSSTDWALLGDSVVILTPEGGASPKHVASKIEIDIINKLKGTEFSDIDIGESANVSVASDRIDGKLGTVVTVRHKQTNALIYSKVYLGTELAIGVTPEDEKVLKSLRKTRAERERSAILARKERIRNTTF